ncbi:MAG: hypothetical protein NWF07_08035 [Candidatus Bathyarchaeota archaeon]|nr:hypothetical protein [Candidatus Bathyarchaeota archaeon]
MGILSGSRREMPIFFLSIIVFALIAEGYLDRYLWIVVPSLFFILAAYLWSNRRTQYPEQIQ